MGIALYVLFIVLLVPAVVWFNCDDKM